MDVDHSNGVQETDVRIGDRQDIGSMWGAVGV